MTKLDIAISSIKYAIECNEEEADSFREIIKSLNTKTNELMIKTGKISDRLLLFILLLINQNKKDKIFNNFESNIVKLMRQVKPLLSRGSDLDGQLIMANIIKENETSGLEESNTSVVSNEEIKATLEERNAMDAETIKFIDEIITFVEKLANNINDM